MAEKKRKKDPAEYLPDLLTYKSSHKAGAFVRQGT